MRRKPSGRFPSCLNKIALDSLDCKRRLWALCFTWSVGPITFYVMTHVSLYIIYVKIKIMHQSINSLASNCRSKFILAEIWFAFPNFIFYFKRGPSFLDFPYFLFKLSGICLLHLTFYLEKNKNKREILHLAYPCFASYKVYKQNHNVVSHSHLNPLTLVGAFVLTALF